MRHLSIPLLLIVASTLAGAEPARTVWDGVYSPEQAKRGEAAYTAECSRCHRDDFGGYGNVLTGARFMDKWREDSVKSFYDLVKNTMPRNAPASLSDGAYLDIVAYILQSNEFPTGKSELKLDSIAAVRVEGKGGPAPVPDFALVQVAGCLAQRTDGEWIVLRATEPIRTRNPTASAPDELKMWDAKAAGPHTFRLMDATYVNTHPPKDQKVLAKGLLIRQAGDDRLNTSALQATGSACAK